MGIGGIQGGNNLPGGLVSQEKLHKREEVSALQKDKMDTGNHSLPEESQKDTELVKLKYRQSDIEKLSLSFQQNENYENVGRDSDIQNLDMQKAISEMKKDQVLQQYQYFIGSSKNIFHDFGDGMVIPK